MIAHMDGCYATPDGKEQSFFTIHLYLNDKNTQENPDVPMIGGATSFMEGWNSAFKEGIQVEPEVGSVLVFQHEHLVHSGDPLESGIKYTLRSDLMYERIE
jgi:hypothetical protein